MRFPESRSCHRDTDFSRFASTPGKGDLLFHYTTMAGFLGIFDSGVIYASHIQYLNDSAEFTYAINRIQEELRSLNARQVITKIVREFLGAPASNSPTPAGSLYGRLLNVAPAMKDPSFKEEAEWRLISYAASSTDSIRAVGFRTDGSMVIPYCRVPLNQGEGRRVDLAEAIVVGPTPHPELSKASIALMMYKRNLRPRPRVENSKVPYRNW